MNVCLHLAAGQCSYTGTMLLLVLALYGFLMQLNEERTSRTSLKYLNGNVQAAACSFY